MRYLSVIFLTLVTIVLQPSDAICCLNCASVTSGDCGVCATNYYLYKSKICLSACPYGYSISSGSCIESSSKIIADIDFSLITDWTITTVNSFSTPAGGPLNSPSVNSLIPTKGQGFYSIASTYLLNSLGWVPSPDITITFWVLIKGDGHIFELVTTTYINIKVQVSSNLYQLFLKPLNQANSQYEYTIINTFTSTSLWELAIFNIIQTTSSLITVNYKLNSNSGSITISDHEGQYAGPYHWSIGCRFSQSFVGFLYRLLVVNDNDSTVLTSFTTTVCPFNTYASGASCNACGASCSTWPWCISSSTCSPCFSSDCSYCTGFAASECFCSNAEIYPNCCQIGCSTCGSFWICSACQLGYNLIDSSCLDYCPSGSCGVLSSTPIFDIKFTDFQGSYSGFVTGNDANKYQFFNNPESIDPIPISSRGLWFNSNMYLHHDSVLLAHTFTIALWVMPTNGNILKKGNDLKITSNAIVTLQIFSKTDSISTLTSTGSTLISWSYISVSVSFSVNTITLTTYINNSIHSTLTSLDNMFKDYSKSSLVLGDSYTGFIYSCKLWNYLVSSFAFEYSNDICGSGLIASCLNTCFMNQYVSGSCNQCLSTCDSGCVNANDCNICKDPLCRICSSFTSSCSQCKTTAFILNNQCFLCSSRCQTCSGQGNYLCTSCTPTSYSWGTSICLAVCPSGYSGPNCGFVNSLALNLTFSSLEINSVGMAIIGSNSSNVYPEFDINDPFPAKHRGYYFKGSSAVEVVVVLAPTFTVNVWCKAVGAGILLSKTGIIRVYLDISTEIQVSLMNNQQITVNHTHSFDVWTLLTYSVKIDLLNIYINSISASIVSLIAPFEDFSQSNLVISDKNQGFTGFLYSVFVYNQAEQLFYHSSSCPNTGFCLNNCSISQDPANNCNPCPSECENGCYNSTCSLCKYPLCSHCNNYDSCYDCKRSSYLANDTCLCNSGYYLHNQLSECLSCPLNCLICDETQCLVCISGFHLKNFICEPCSSKCKSCELFCNSCIENAFLSSGSCHCIPGFAGDQCLPAFFNATLLLMGNNNLLLYFSDDLATSLSISDLVIETTPELKWYLASEAANKYLIFLSLPSSYSKITVTLRFASKLYSINNYLLSTVSLSLDIPKSSNYDTNIKTDEMKGYYEQGSTYTIVAMFSISLLSPNPACLWSFTNTVQFVCFMYLSSIPFTPRIKGLLIGLRSFMIFPNAVDYIYHPELENESKNSIDLGFKTSSVLVNIGKQITAFSIFLSYFFIMFLLGKIQWKYSFIREGIKDILKEFKYGYFIRFSIQTYLEFCCAFYIGIIHPQFDDIEHLFNFIVSVIVGVIYIKIVVVSFPLLCFLIIHHNRGCHHDVAAPAKTLYGSLFYEFSNEENFITSYFYAIFFIKRLCYMSVLFILKDYPIIQVSLSCTFCIASFFYICSVAPFQEKILNITHALCEAGIVIFFIVLSMLLFENRADKLGQIDDALVVIINFVMSFHMIAAVVVFAKNLYIKVKIWRDEKKMPKIHSIDEDEQKNSHEDLSSPELYIMKRSN